MKVQRMLSQETNEVTFDLLDDAGQPIEIVSRFMRHLHARDYSPNTLSAYCFDLLHFMTFLNAQHLTYEQFTPACAWTLLEYLRELPSRTQAQRFGLVLCTTNQGRSTTRLSPATINRILAAVSSFYEYLIVADLFPGRENPIQKIDDSALARVSERHRPFMGSASRQRPIRNFGAPEALVTDGGGIFYSNVAIELYGMLGIRKERIDPGEPWENYAETLLYVMWNLENSLHNLHYVDLTLDSSDLFKSNEWQFHIISIQRRLADHAFSNARNWPEIELAHRTWWTNYNSEHHFAHQARQDGRHSPEAVLRGMLGRTYPDEVLSRVLYATQFTRHLDRHGYVRFKNWRFKGCDGLAGEEVSVWMYEGMLKIEYQATALSEYALHFSPDHKQIEAVNNPRRIETHFRSPQLHLWQTSEAEWLLALRQPERHKQKIRRVAPSVVQLRFPEMDNLGEDQAFS